jgi:DNA modification methylase
MIEIKEEFKKLIPALTAEEFKQLEENILKDGIRDPLVLWNGYLIDGHNRYQIAFKHGLEYKTIDKEFKDESEVKEWMINNQFGRRNLSNYQRSVLALELESVFSKRAKKQQGQRNDIKPTLAESKPIETRKELSKIANVSHGTLDKVKVIESKATPEVKAQLSTGEVSINQIYQEIKKEEKKINFEQKKSEFEKEIKSINTNQIIILGDSIKVLPTLKNNSFDLLLSDPPYGMDFKSGWNNKEKITNDKIEDTIVLFENVLKEVVPLLKEDAHFYLFGNIDFLPEIKPIIKKYLTLKSILIWDRKIIGMGDLKSYGFSYDIIYFGYNKIWKDLNGTRDKDILSFNRVTPSANIHPTEKPIDLLEYLIKKSTNENDKILDPFAGGGSTLIACKNTNRLATGIEIDENYFNLINKKI